MEMNESNNIGSLNFVQLVRDGLIDHAGMYSQVKGWSKTAIKTLLDDMRNEAFGIEMLENTGANQPKKQRLADMIDFIAAEFCPSYDYYRKAPAIEKQVNADFMGCLLVHEDKKKELLLKLHSLIDGKKGKGTALVIHICVELGLMSKPTFGVLSTEFPGIGHNSCYNAYYRDFSKKYTDDEISGIRNHLTPFQEQN